MSQEEKLIPRNERQTSGFPAHSEVQIPIGIEKYFPQENPISHPGRL
jgi:hypothetical protein